MKKVVGGDSHDLIINRAFHSPVCDFKQPFVERDVCSSKGAFKTKRNGAIVEIVRKRR